MFAMAVNFATQSNFRVYQNLSSFMDLQPSKVSKSTLRSIDYYHISAPFLSLAVDQLN